LRTSSNSKSHATVNDGQIVTEPTQRKAYGNVSRTAFQVEHKDGYESDVDDGPHANVAFMANLSATYEQEQVPVS
nr:hypothetical protein [Tanacetum cinerariifolium]